MQKERVPRLFKVAANIIKNVKENNQSVDDLICNAKHPRISSIRALVIKALQCNAVLDILLQETGIAENEKGLQTWLAKILITELLWGKKTLPWESKPCKTILSYRESLESALQKAEESENVVSAPVHIREGLPRFVRVQTLQTSVENAIEYFVNEGWNLVETPVYYNKFKKAVKNLTEEQFMQDYHIKEILIFSSYTNFHHHPLYMNGSIAIQDKASCLSAYVLNPPSGSVVLDMCAAPGMKTVYLASLMNNDGKIYAIEQDKKRYTSLLQCIEHFCGNNSCIEAYCGNALKSSSEDFPEVEYILVDPSCSGTGMVKRNRIHQDTEPDFQRIQYLQSFQKKILLHALTKFPKARRVVYSTCSLLEEENEQVVNSVLEQVNDFHVVPSVIDSIWLNKGNSEYSFGQYCLCATNQNDLTNGFFVAVFERQFETETNNKKRQKDHSSSKTKKKRRHKEEEPNEAN